LNQLGIQGTNRRTMFKNAQDTVSDEKNQIEITTSALPGKSVTELMMEQQKAEDAKKAGKHSPFRSQRQG